MASLTPYTGVAGTLAAFSGASGALDGGGPDSIGDVPGWDGDSWIFHRVFNIKFFGAVGDGVTDDQPAIQDALDAVEAAGGGELYIPHGTFLLVTENYISGVRWHLSVGADNINITGPGTLKTATATASIFYLGGAMKASNNWDAIGNTYEDWGSGKPTVYIMTAAAIDATQVTLATAAQASNFSAADKILIRTGQLLAARITEPDAEINEVVTSSASTGVLTLKYPLTKSYAQEYYVTGTTGLTTTSVTANLAPFGVAKVTDRTSVNVTLDGFAMQGAGYHCIIAGQIDGLTVKNLRVTGSPMLSAGTYRGGQILNNTNHFSGGNNYGITCATTTTDVLIFGNTLSNDAGMNQIHLHEGTARIRVGSNRMTNKSIGVDFNAISIRARAYALTIEGNEIVNGYTSGIAIYADETCTGGGIIRGNRIRGTFSDAIGVAATGWKVYDNDTPATISSYYPTPLESSVQTLSGWVKFGAQTLTLGTLPAYSLVTRVTIIVADFAFNSSGTDQITVGHDAGNNYYAPAADVSVAYTRVDATSTAWSTFNSVSRVAKAYYVNGGTEPTVGEALVVLEYTLVGRS